VNGVLRTYLWKEWREQRATLAWLSGLLVLLALVALTFLPRSLASRPFLIEACGAVAVLTWLMTLGSDLLPRELASDRVRFLERAPGGLRKVFVAKLLLFAAAGIVIAALGASLGLGIALLREEAPSLWNGVPDVGWAVLAVVGFSLWTLAASTWVPRGALALPAAAMALAVLAWPLLVLAPCLFWYEPEEGEIALYALLATLAAPVVAWVSFTSGFRFGRGTAQASLRGFGVAVLFLLPGWCVTGVQVHRALTIYPLQEDFEIVSCELGSEGRFAYATTSRGSKFIPHALVVDLETGGWRSEGFGIWYPSRERYGLSLESHESLLHVWLFDLDNDEEAGTCFDARSAKEVDPRTVPEIEWDLPGAKELGLDPERGHWRRAGLGYQAVFENGGYYDPFRSTLFRESELFPEKEPRSVKVRPGRWLLYDHDRSGIVWTLFDPETGDRAPAPAMEDVTWTCPFLEDGRLIVVEEGRVCLLDPESGAQTPVTLEGEWPGTILWVYSRAKVVGPEGILLVSGDEWRTLGRLDRSTLTLPPARYSSNDPIEWVASLDEDSVLAIEDRRRLVRLFFDDRAPEVLFPRPEE